MVSDEQELPSNGWRLSLKGRHPRFHAAAREMPGLVFAPGLLDPGACSRAGALGIPVIALPCTADFDPYGRSAPCWIGEGRYDHAPIDRGIEMILAAHPEAHLIADITTCSPEWWDALHPGEMVVWEDRGSIRRPLDRGCLKARVPSLASGAWRRAMAANVRALVRHVEASPRAGRVIGYLVRFGTRGSWTHFGTTEGYLFDYNPQVAGRFRAWLEGRYGGDSALASAWGRSPRLESVLPPRPEERAAVDPRGFRHPAAQCMVIDYGLFLADLAAETVLDLARTVKAVCGRRALFGATYGHFFDLLPYQNGLQHSGQLGLHRVLSNPDVDFLVAPALARPSDPGTGGALSTAPEASVRLSGKVLFHGAGGGASVLGRAVTCALDHGMGLWWEGLNPGAPSPDGDERACREAIERFQGGPPSRSPPRNRIALVIDDVSMFYIERPAEQFVELLSAQCIELSRLAAPFDLILRRDLRGAHDYRFLLFPNLFYADQETRDSIRDSLRLAGATALWIGAPGFVDEAPRFENMERMTGIRVRKPDRPHAAMIRAGMDGREVRYGAPRMHAHVPIIDDSGCAVIGHYEDSALPGLGIKDQDGWRSIYSGAPAVCAELLERFALEAGALAPEGRGA